MILLACLMGCANNAFILAAPDYEAERGKSSILVLPILREPAAGPIIRDAVRMLTAELASRWFNVLDLDLVRRASPQLEPHLMRLAQQVLAGQVVDRSMADTLFLDHGVGQLLVLDVFRYDQYWGRETKITRVGMEARLVHVAEGRMLWQGRYDPELSDSPGHGFDAATRRVVRELVRFMTNGSPEFRDTPFAKWPILEHLAPN
jgi:hypothetical protein